MVAKASLIALIALAVAAPPVAVGTFGLGPFGFRAESTDLEGTAEVPAWTVGTVWTYALRARVHGPVAKMVLLGNMTLTVAERLSAEESGVGAEVFEVDLHADLDGRALGPVRGPAGNVTLEEGLLAGTLWYRTDDLRLVRETLGLSLEFSSDRRNLTVEALVTNTFDPGLALFAFPLEVDKAWDRTTTVHSEGSWRLTVEGPLGTLRTTREWNVTLTLPGSAKVVSLDNVTTPAGEFSAFHILSNAGRMDRGDDDRDDGRDEGEDAEAGDEGDEGSGVDYAAALPEAPQGCLAHGMGRLAFQPASHLWYSSDVGNVVAFKVHLHLGMAKVMAVGALVAHSPG